MNVIAKFTCDKKEETSDGFEISMSPVTCGSAENDDFFNYTPSGNLSMGLVGADAAACFEVGQEYYINIVPAN